MSGASLIVRLRTYVALTAAALAATAPAGRAQEPIEVRLLQAEDARQLTPETQALFVEGMKSPDPKVRAQAVRAAGRFETPALIFDVLPLLADRDANVRRWAAIAAASSARVFGMEALETLVRVMPAAEAADWAEFAASVGRIPVVTEDQFHQVEQAILTGLPAPASSPQVVRAPRRAVPAAGAAAAGAAVRTEGAARGLEALTRVSGKVHALSADGRARLALVVETPDAPGSQALVRARRLALQALRNARAVDGDLLRVAARDPDDEVRRLAVGAAGAAVTAEAPSLVPADVREAILAAALKDPEPRVRYEALGGWGRHLQVRTCQPVLAALQDPSPHVALLALDLLGGGCGPATPVAAALGKEASALPPAAGAWHRAAHAVVSLARVAPDAARPLLPRFAGHPTWQVRMYAARAAGQAASIDTLTRLGADDRDNVRNAALDELARLQRPEALAVAYAALDRNDYQLIMTAARALTAEPERARAAKALVTALVRLSLQGRDTSRDPRVAILTALADVGSRSDVEAISGFLTDPEPRVADQAAKALERWTGEPRQATPRARRLVGPDLEMLQRASGQRLRITMAGGGVMELRLLADEAPATVARVAALASKGYYDGLTFHRVEPTFVLQGGSPGANEYMGDGPYMRDEPGVAHLRGTVGISTRGRDTGDAQIFVNLVDSPRLDHAYTVFAVVERGMDVADRVLEGDVMTKVELVDGPGR
ncbi:MAG: peptidylprolyl isomerase [Vicinamibacterales bacterium]